MTVDTPLRFALLTSGDHVERWLADSIARTVGLGLAECVAVVGPDQELAIRNRASRVADVVGSPKYWAHFALRASVSRTPFSDAVALNDTCPDSRHIAVRTNQRGAVVRIDESDLDALRALDLDFVLLHEFGILKGAVLDVARFGVWSFHHGDPRTYRGRPSCFWELHDGVAVVSAGLQQINETLDGGHFMRMVSVATKPSFGATMTSLYRASTTLLSATCEEVRVSGEVPPAIELPTPLPTVRGRPSNAAVATAIGRVARRAAEHLWRGAFIRRDWELGVGCYAEGDDPWSVVPERLEWFSPGKRTQFWADPSVVACDDTSATVFLEEFDYRVGYGKIVMLRIEHGAVAERVVVLDDGHHHAFPQALRSEQGWIATTDSCCEPAPMYRFGSPGDAWEPIPDASLPPGLVDPNLVRLEGRWMVIATDRRFDSSSWCVAYETDTLGRDWRPVRPNPLFVDATCARGGGTLDVGRQIRVAQDCSTGYGDAVRVMPLRPGDPGQASRSRTDALATVDGTHTIAWHGDDCWVAADRCVYRFSLLAWRHRLKERSMRRSCNASHR